MTDTERFEQFLRETAADYQEPSGEVPREEMWNAIRARRVAVPAPIPSIGIAPTRRRQWYFATAAMAAMLLVGVAIGRFAARDVTAPSLAAAPASAAPSSVALAPDPVSTDPSGSARNSLDDRHNGSAAPNIAYSAVANRHLASVEALLTSYEASKADAHPDTLLGAWAKSLLSDTRLLMDSPVAHDPARARLLSDLELILVQLVQRATPADTSARSAVERTLEKKQIIPRLRSAVPASLLSGTD
jgi:hypothetical protein